MSTNRKVSLDGVLLYAQVQSPSKYKKYSTDFIPGGVSQEAEDLAISLGAIPKTVKNDKELAEIDRLGLTGKKVFTAERLVILSSGKKLEPLLVIDAKGNPLTALLSNGTKARLHGTLSTYVSEGKTITRFYMDTVQVFDLVPYVPTKATNTVPPMDGFDITTVNTTEM